MRKPLLAILFLAALCSPAGGADGLAAAAGSAAACDSVATGAAAGASGSSR